jgi:hypothetical protein
VVLGFGRAAFTAGCRRDFPGLALPCAAGEYGAGNSSGSQQSPGPVFQKEWIVRSIAGGIAIFLALVTSVVVQPAKTQTETTPGNIGNRGPNAAPAIALDDGPTRSYIEKMASSDYLKLRQQYAASQQFDPDGLKSLTERKAMHAAFSAGDFQTVSDKAAAILGQHFTDIDSNIIASLAYSKLGKAKLARRHMAIATGLMGSITATGDGKSPEHAFEVLTILEEYAIVQGMNLTLVSQATHSQAGRLYDQLVGSDAHGTSQTVTFQLVRPPVVAPAMPAAAASPARQPGDPWAGIPAPKIKPPKPAPTEQTKASDDDPGKLDKKKMNVCRGC